MKLSVLLLLSILLLTSCASGARRPAAESPSEGRHFIFLLHGINGSPEDFGVMAEGLRIHLKDENGRAPIAQALRYETRNDVKTTVEFAKDIAVQMRSVISEQGGLRKDDRISLIMHSQGGIVGTIWLTRSALGDPEFAPELVDHVDSFITLGTPFWGAKIAHFGADVIGPLRAIGFKLAELFGIQQLKDMHFNSPVVHDFRKNAIAPENQELWNTLRRKIRFLQIAGVATQYNFLAPFVVGESEFEDDTAVPLPSQRFDFYHWVEAPSDHSDERIVATRFKRTRFVDQFVIVKAFHTTAMPEISAFYDEKNIPGKCLNPDLLSCDHPTFPRIVRHLRREDSGASEYPVPTSFIVSYTIHFSDDVKQDDVKVSRTGSEHVNLGKRLQFYNNHETWVNPRLLRGYVTGYVSRDSRSRVSSLSMKIEAPGFKTREVEVPVEGAMTSFFELSLESNGG